jgi:hypothetical protein
VTHGDYGQSGGLGCGEVGELELAVEVPRYVMGTLVHVVAISVFRTRYIALADICTMYLHKS